MTAKALIASLVFANNLLVGDVLAKPNMTPEQLAKARETAAQMTPPVDFDALLDEADRLGVVCEGNLTIKGNIKTCKYRIETAQSKERVAVSRERQAKLDEEINAKGEKIERILEDTKRIANQKLNK
jgi:hypothetical protein